MAQEVVDGLGNLLGAKAAAILLNISLLGGGAFLMYFGIARAFGVGQPVGTPLRAVRGAAVAGAMA